jgi:hypothetical protein
MKSVLLPACVLLLSWLTVALAQAWSKPYVPRDGAQVLGNYRSNSE